MRLTMRPITCIMKGHDADEYYVCITCYRLVHVNDLMKIRRYTRMIENGFGEGNGVAISRGISNILDGINKILKRRTS